ncbi:MAG TPA: hypothetical protein VGZ29_05595 [Terriglobia bacterium]|nr:hypothetical protein [Terriglobia bacterium]
MTASTIPIWSAFVLWLSISAVLLYLHGLVEDWYHAWHARRALRRIDSVSPRPR